MLMREDLVKMIRRFQTVTAIILFFAVFLLCWKTTNFQITEIQLSDWGKSGIIGYLWNTALCGLAISTLINSFLYIKKSNRIRWKWFSYSMFGFVSFALFATGFFNLNWGWIHNISAWIYFFMYPLVIFIHTHINRSTLLLSDWRAGILISMGMIVLPLLSVSLFSGMAIPETIHIIFVIIWNLKIAFK
jgi:hypothetical membrane protein